MTSRHRPADVDQEATPEPHASLDELLGLPFSQPGLWTQALTHRSYAFEQGLTDRKLDLEGDVAAAGVHNLVAAGEGERWGGDEGGYGSCRDGRRRGHRQ